MGKITKRGFWTIPHAVLYHPGISAKAKGLWVYIQAKPEDYDFSSVRMANEMSDGIGAIQSGLKELEKWGLLVRRLESAGRGKFDHEYVLNEVPNQGNTVPENTVPENSIPINPVSNKERGSKKELERKIEQEHCPSESASALPVAPLIDSIPEPTPTAIAPKKEFGRPELNAIVEAVKAEVEANGWIYDKADERKCSAMLFAEKAFAMPGITKAELAAEIVKRSADWFWAGKITSCNKIVRHWKAIANEARQASKAKAIYNIQTI